MANGSLHPTAKTEFHGRTYRFALSIIRFIENIPKDRASNIIVDQLLRSSTSIGANVVESQASSSRKDYANFFSYALKSANEIKFWLSLLRDSGKCCTNDVDPLINEVNELANILGASILTLKRKNI